MNDIVKIEDTEMQIREYGGQRVVTFKDIDMVHKRPDGTSKNAFKRNKKHLVENEDYVILKPKVHETYFRNIVVPNRGITVLTESGYLLLVKVFDDELAWKVQRQLVNSYFRLKEIDGQFQPQDERPQIGYRTSSTPVPRNPNWYARNRRRMNEICENAGISLSTLYHHILLRLGEEYDLNAANRIYRDELGELPKYPMDIVGYFPELGRMADAYLDRIEKL